MGPIRRGTDSPTPTGYPDHSVAWHSEGRIARIYPNGYLPGTGDAGWPRAFHAVVPPLRRVFRPQVLVSQHGCDSHRLDPLAHFDLSVDTMHVACIAVHRLAHETAGGRWVLIGGGGYALVQVVPRAWAHLLAEAAGRPVDPGAPTPPTWRQYAQARTGERALLIRGGAPVGRSPGR